MEDLLTHKLGVFGGEVFENLREDFPAFEGAFGGLEVEAELADSGFGEEFRFCRDGRAGATGL
jgi:hypothetical protein